MKSSKSNLKETFRSKGFEVKEADWANMHLSWETYHERLDTTPFMKLLPEGVCKIPHWGYMLKGEMKINYEDGEERIWEGEAYYIAPGHVVTMEAGSEVIEFSPSIEPQIAQDDFS